MRISCHDDPILPAQDSSQSPPSFQPTKIQEFQDCADKSLPISIISGDVRSLPDVGVDDHAISRISSLEKQVLELIGEPGRELGILPEHCLGMQLDSLSASQLDTIETALCQVSQQLRLAARRNEQCIVLDLNVQLMELNSRIDELSSNIQLIE